MKIKCPICGVITTWEENDNRPFCSARCKMIDLGKWASEDYKIVELTDDSKSVIIDEEEKKD